MLIIELDYCTGVPEATNNKRTPFLLSVFLKREFPNTFLMTGLHTEHEEPSVTPQITRAHLFLFQKKHDPNVYNDNKIRLLVQSEGCWW